MPKNVLKNQGRTHEVGTNIGNIFTSRSLTAALSTMPEVISFYLSGKGLYLGKFE